MTYSILGTGVGLPEKSVVVFVSPCINLSLKAAALMLENTADGCVVGDQGTLGQQIASAAKLVDLQVKQNRFSALGLTFLEAPSRLPPGLTFCDISDNQLRGTVPEGLVRHPNLIVLHASRNSFSVSPANTFSSGAQVVNASLCSEAIKD